MLGEHLAGAAEMLFPDVRARAPSASPSGWRSSRPVTRGQGSRPASTTSSPWVASCFAPARLGRHAPGDGVGTARRARRRAPRLRPLRPARLGARGGAPGPPPGRTGAERATSPGNVRSLRRGRNVPLGRSGHGIACAALTTREFGPWAKEAWPRLSDAVIAGLSRPAWGAISSSYVAASTLGRRRGHRAVTRPGRSTVSTTSPGPDDPAPSPARTQRARRAGSEPRRTSPGATDGDRRARPRRARAAPRARPRSAPGIAASKGTRESSVTVTGSKRGLIRRRLLCSLMREGAAICRNIRRLHNLEPGRDATTRSGPRRCSTCEGQLGWCTLRRRTRRSSRRRSTTSPT